MIGYIIVPMFGNISNNLGNIRLSVPIRRVVVGRFLFFFLIGEWRKLLRQTNGKGV